MSQLLVPGVPQLPNPAQQYDVGLADQHNRALGRYFSSLTSTLQQVLLGFNHYGTFYDTNTKTNAVANTANLVTFNTTGEAFGIALAATTSRVTVSRDGVYRISYVAQLDKTGAGVGTAYFWGRLNGTDITASASKVAVNGATDEKTVTKMFVLEMHGGDYFEVVWSADDTGVTLPAATAASPVPAIPSVRLSIVFAYPGDVSRT